MKGRLLVFIIIAIFNETVVAQSLSSLNNRLANYYNWSLSNVCSHPGSNSQGGWDRHGSGVLAIGRDDTDYYDHCGSQTGPTASVNLNVNTRTFFGAYIYVRVTLKAKNYANNNYGRGEFYVNSTPYFSMYNVANSPSINSSQVHNSAIGYAGYSASGTRLPRTGTFPNIYGISGHRTSNDQYSTFVIRIPNPNTSSLNLKWRFMSGKDDLFFGRVEILGESLPPKCTVPSACNVTSSSGNDIDVGGTSIFSVSGGAPSNSTSWSVSPSTGVSASSGASSSTGTLVFSTPGTYDITFRRLNSNSPANCAEPKTVECTRRIIVNSPPPDFYPTLLTGKTVISGPEGNIDFHVVIGEASGRASNSVDPVEFRIADSGRFNFEFDSGLNSINGIEVNNSDWTYLLEGGLHKFTYIANGGIFPKSSFSKVGIKAVFNSPRNAVGKVPLKITLKSNSGGQTNTQNDNDQDVIEYKNKG
ncbi:hypothetical protein SAMN04489761_3318 [Tenacibaculum sp. MAR_2009_124]|uniref:hypothetical protein n=1 Tax=Tenacibaculum sp. MAR_2009_124 TaxID=1250059 RepID=UPI00089A6622|nr:hypothetical protein [Tenacibaculum sp. MAR_2009_124]SEC55749.1 hypothetical protein SAMN04489761_3318 [Tenacibaculum sp. MAR_2009_124]